MSLTFQHCRTCGGKIQIDLRVPAAQRRCMLCGGPCSDDEAIDAAEEPEPGTGDGDGPGAGHTPAEMRQTECPHCRTKIAVRPDKAFAEQHCPACGVRLEEAPQKSRMRKRSRFTSDGLLQGQQRERVWMPIAGIMLALVLAAIFAIWMGWRPDTSPAPPAQAAPPDVREAIKTLGQQFIAAKTPEEMLPLLRDPDKIAPQLQAWCAARPGVLPLGGGLLHISYPREMAGTSVIEFTAGFQSVPGTNLLAVATPAGWRVDWHAFTGIADLSVEEFLVQKPSHPTAVMVVAHRSDYYNGAYADSRAWVSLRATDRTGEHPFFAWAPRRDDAVKAALAVLPAADSRDGLNVAKVSRPLTLRLRFASPESAARNEAEVTSVAGEGWFVP